MRAPFHIYPHAAGTQAAPTEALHVITCRYVPLQEPKRQAEVARKLELEKERYQLERRRSEEALAAGEWAEAEAHLTRAIAVNARNPALYSSRSFASLRQRKDARALQDAKKVTELDPLSSIGYYRQGRALTFQMNYVASGRLYLQASELAPHGPASDGRFDDVGAGMRTHVTAM